MEVRKLSEFFLRDTFCQTQVFYVLTKFRQHNVRHIKILLV